MVGSLSQKKEYYALIKTPDNNLYRVRTGDFMGQNFGRVIDITESSVKLKELIQDSGNDWKEEERLLLLQDEQEARK
jgi:type IV pilus assembly protein PilP